MATKGLGVKWVPLLCFLIFILVSGDLARGPSRLDLSLPYPGKGRLSSRESPFRYAIHTLFLDEVVASLAADVGFDTVVQVFPWRDLNPYPNFYDWQASDYMVHTAHAYGLDLVVRLDMPPEWATLPDEYAYGGLPFDLPAYADFIETVAERYRGDVAGYIIWNEPNLAAEWSCSGGDALQHWESFDGWVANPADYVLVLCTVYDIIRVADPDAQVVSAGLAPTNEFSSRAMDDREFLRQMYIAGAAGCFDVLSVHDYGYGLSPEDERDAHSGLNLARILDLRDIMLQYDEPKPVWITELGYTVQPGQHPSVSEEEQALYLTGAFGRVRRDWPWVEMLTVWNLCYGLPVGHEMSGYSLVNSDRTPRLAYWALREMLRRGR